MDQPVKCACLRCNCTVAPDRAVLREGKVYCSPACAYDCSDATCVCVHDRCELVAGRGVRGEQRVEG